MIEGKRLRDAGHLVEAIQCYSRAVSLARNGKDSTREARSLILMSAAQILHFEYSAALESAKGGLEAAARAGNPMMLGAASNNISNVYGQLGDLPSADLAANRAVEALRSAETDARVKDPLARALVNRASIYFLEKRDNEALRDSTEALALAGTSNFPLQAVVWEARGTFLMRAGNLPEALNAFEKEYSIRKDLSDLNGLAITKEHLAELEIRKERPDYTKALRLMDEAFSSASVAFKSNVPYYPIHIRAEILLKSGEELKALTEFKRAVNVAADWRLGALPGDLTNTQTVASLQEVYADYAQLAARIALQTNDRQLSADALQTLSMNRAASLRDQLRLALSRNLQLPDVYFLKLSQLQAAQAQVTFGRSAKEAKTNLQRIRGEVADLENQNGIKPLKDRLNKERNSRRNRLSDIQATLTRDQVLLSISLGKTSSYLWAVTGDQVNLMQIASESELKSAAESFANSIRMSASDAPAKAAVLGRELFGSLPKQAWQKPEWLIVADGALLSGIPFCSLPDQSAKGTVPLIARRSLRLLPSELLLLGPRNRALPQRFVGVGDPIYNQADSRLVRTPAADAKTISPAASLARLPGSEKEIRSAARESRAPATILLMGPRATREDIQSATQTDSAAFLHFAVHVVSPPGQPEQAALALSLKNGIPELLTPEVIGSFRLAGSLVVLSGCSSDQGKALPGAGLMGLSRAWLVAGASAVVVSSWPTPDDSGKFFSAFYRHLDEISSGSLAQRAAQALRQTQMDMLHGTGYRTSPGFWSAFSIISKE